MTANPKIANTPLKSHSTRQKILEVALDDMHIHGYQGMRIDRILETTGLAKGALYHHFPNKQALGYAVVDELLALHNRDLWVGGLARGDDPITGLQGIIRFYFERYGKAVVKNGCPLINLCQEMPALDNGFRQRLGNVYSQWIGAIVGAIEDGQAQGLIKDTLDPDTIAKFIVSSFQGITIAVKCTESLSNFEKLTNTLIDYVESLRV